MKTNINPFNSIFRNGIIFLMCFGITACFVVQLPVGPHDFAPTPTSPSTVEEVILLLTDEDYDVRLAAFSVIDEFGPVAEPAVPIIISALSDDSNDIRIYSAEALGAIGEKAKNAVPALIHNLLYDDYFYSRVSAAKALGRIGDARAVPYLAKLLWEQESLYNKRIDVHVAWAIAQITDQDFPDSDDSMGFKTNEDGEALIVLAAKEWWIDEGQFQKWPLLE